MKFFESELNKVRKKLDSDTVTFGEILSRTRDVFGMKQNRMSEILQLSESIYKAYELDYIRKIPDKKKVIKFCEIFCFDFDKVMSVIKRQNDKYQSLKMMRKNRD